MHGPKSTEFLSHAYTAGIPAALAFASPPELRNALLITLMALAVIEWWRTRRLMSKAQLFRERQRQ